MPAAKKPATPPAGPAATADEQRKRWTEATDSIRKRADLTAKAIGALGATGIGAITLKQFSDLFPLPPSPDLALWLAIAGVFAGVVFLALAVALFSARFWKVTRPIFVGTDADEMEDVKDDAKEKARVAMVFDETARLNGAPTLTVYAARGRRLERVAAHAANAAVREKAAAEAAEIRADVLNAQARAAANVVRMRSVEAVTGDGAKALYALFVVAVLVFGVSTDYIDSERTQRVATAKACAEAIKAVRTDAPATAKLIPSICGGKAAVTTPTPTPPPTAKESVAAAAGSVASAIGECDDEQLCARLDKALAALAGTP